MVYYVAAAAHWFSSCGTRKPGKITSASRTRHGAPKATEPLNSMGMPVDTIGNVPHTLLCTLTVVFNATMGVCRVLGGLLQSRCRPPSRTPRPVPERMVGCHHVVSCSESFYVVSASIFDQKNYGTRTHIARGHSFRLRPIFYSD